MLYSQITLKLLAKNMSFSSFKRIAKVLNTGRWIEVGKIIYSIINYCNIKIAEDSIEKKQFENDYMLKIKITALNKSQRLYKSFYDNY